MLKVGDTVVWRSAIRSTSRTRKPSSSRSFARRS